MYGRTGDWDHQRGIGVSTILAAWVKSGRWRMVSSLPGFQSEAHAHLMAGMRGRFRAPVTRLLKEVYP